MISSDTSNVELPWYILIFLRIAHSHLFLFLRIEKYRPQLLKDVVGNEEIVSRLEVIGKTGNIPNLLLSVHKSFF